jgi:AmiR/NasT family two-component response regulator
MEIRQAVTELQGMSLGLFHPIDAEGKQIADQLSRLGLSFDQVWPPSLERLQSVQVVILSLIPETVSKFESQLVREFKRKIVISVLGYENPTVLNAACQLNSSALLYSPVKPFGVLSSIVLAISQNKLREDLFRRISKLEGRLESVRLIEQAKRFLMDARGVTEEEAFKLLRNRSMDRRCTIEEIAQSIVMAKEALTSAIGDDISKPKFESRPSGDDKPSESHSIRRVK